MFEEDSMKLWWTNESGYFAQNLYLFRNDVNACQMSVC